MCSVDHTWQDSDLKQNCNGRIVSTGSSLVPPMITLCMQLLGMSLFFAFPAKYLYSQYQNVAPIVLGVILSLASLLCFFGTSFRDPGVLPPAISPLYQISDMRPPRTQNIVSSQGNTVLRYCDVCNIFRPPRVEHCPTCKNCISKFDHRKSVRFPCG
jgi:palmitoyltransferase ZDHHC9/14/18